MLDIIRLNEVHSTSPLGGLNPQPEAQPQAQTTEPVGLSRMLWD